MKILNDAEMDAIAAKADAEEEFMKEREKFWEERNKKYNSTFYNFKIKATYFFKSKKEKEEEVYRDFADCLFGPEPEDADKDYREEIKHESEI